MVSQWIKERPDVDMVGLSILMRLRALAMLSDQMAENVSKQLGLKSSELYVLYAMRRTGKPYSLRPTDIFKLLQVTSGTITYRIDRLESLKLVRRLADSEDKRSTVVQLTAAGRRLVDKAIDMTVSSHALPMMDLMADKKEIASFINVLRKLGIYYDQLLPAQENPLMHEVAPGTRRKSK